MNAQLLAFVITLAAGLALLTFRWRWARLEQELAAWLLERLKIFCQLILAVDQTVRQLTQELAACAPRA